MAGDDSPLGERRASLRRRLQVVRGRSPTTATTIASYAAGPNVPGGTLSYVVGAR